STLFPGRLVRRRPARAASATGGLPGNALAKGTHAPSRFAARFRAGHPTVASGRSERPGMNWAEKSRTTREPAIPSSQPAPATELVASVQQQPRLAEPVQKPGGNGERKPTQYGGGVLHCHTSFHQASHEH